MPSGWLERVRIMADFNDWVAIANVKAAYCRLLDTKDWDAWRRLFTNDFASDTSDSGGKLISGACCPISGYFGGVVAAGF